MKKILSILIVTFLAVSAWSQAVTNAVKISALPTAGSITGNEQIPMIQLTSGTNATVTATVAQINAPALNFAQTGSNTLQQEIIATTNAALLVSNNVNAGKAALLTVSNAFLNVSNSLNASVAAAVTVSNALTVVSNALNIANGNIANTTTTLTALDGTATSLQSQINTISAQLGNQVSNNATAVFTRVRTPAYFAGAVQVPSGTIVTNLVDFSNGTFQRIFVGLQGSGARVYFTPTNFADGDNLWLEVICTNAQAGFVGTTTGTTGGTIDSWLSGTSFQGGYALQLSGAVKTALENWQVFGTSLVWTMAVHP